MKEIDLHGLGHSKVKNLLGNWLILECNKGNMPLKLITGKSLRMKKIVHRVAKEFKFKVTQPMDGNAGVLVIRE